jgi:hypothetical protein
MWLILITACVVVAGGFLSVAAYIGERTVRRRERAMAERDLVRIGLVVTGDVLGRFRLQSGVHGIELSVVSEMEVMIPGLSEVQKPVCIIEGRADGRNLFVCKKADVDLAMGPLPSVPRTFTGDSAFDEEYAVFISPLEEATPMRPDYRARPPGPMDWAQPEILKAMLELRMVWMRMIDGKCVIAVEPIEVGNAPAAVTLGANVLRATSSRPLVVSAPLRPRASPYVSLALLQIIGSIMLSFITGLLAVPAMGDTVTLRTLAGETICGTAHAKRMKMDCLSTDWTPPAAYYLTCGLFYYGIVSFVSASMLLLLQTGRIPMRRRGPPGGGGPKDHPSLPA